MAKIEKTDKQLTKSLKIRALKCVRKADRTRPPKAKLDKVDEAIKCYKQVLELAEDPMLERYIELCELFKLKVQIDALRDQASQYLSQAEEDKEHSEILVKKALSRLQAVLDIEPGNDNTKAEISRIEEQYRDKLFHGHEKPLLNFKENWNLRIRFKLKGFQNLLENWDGYQRYNLKVDPLESDVYTLDFTFQDILTFREVYEELKTETPVQAYIDGKQVEDEIFVSWLQCYGNYLRRPGSNYCYGATPFSYNFIGCHKAQLRDMETRWENCWFRFGEMDPSLGIFFVDKEQLFLKTQANLLPYTFCPALNLEKLNLGFQLLPNSINPQKDKNWDYVLSKGEKIGVIPKGKEVFITLNHPASDTPQPVQTDSTSQLKKCLVILEGKLSIGEIREDKNVKASCCIHCEHAYEAGSTLCMECGESFWQEILGSRRSLLRGFFRRFGRKKVPALPATPVFPQDLEENKFPSLDKEKMDVLMSLPLDTGVTFKEKTEDQEFAPEMGNPTKLIPLDEILEMPSVSEGAISGGDMQDSGTEVHTESTREESSTLEEEPSDSREIETTHTPLIITSSVETPILEIPLLETPSVGEPLLEVRSEEARIEERGVIISDSESVDFSDDFEEIDLYEGESREEEKGYDSPEVAPVTPSTAEEMKSQRDEDLEAIDLHADRDSESGTGQPEMEQPEVDFEEEYEESPSTVKEMIPKILEDDLKEDLVSHILDDTEPPGSEGIAEPIEKDPDYQGSKERKSLIIDASDEFLVEEQNKIHTVSEEVGLRGKVRNLFLKSYRERKKLETAFKAATPEIDSEYALKVDSESYVSNGNGSITDREKPSRIISPWKSPKETKQKEVENDLIKKIKAIKSTSDLSKRGVVRIVYSAIIDRDTCPLCRFLHGMVFHPDQPEADVFKPPLHKGCKCMRTYILNSEKPRNWPAVNFEPPSDELLKHLELAKLRQYIAERSSVDK
jgi:SPP1 gp7 family putative phage head morphogenesis protein